MRPTFPTGKSDDFDSIYIVRLDFAERHGPRHVSRHDHQGLDGRAADCPCAALPGAPSAAVSGAFREAAQINRVIQTAARYYGRAPVIKRRPGRHCALDRRSAEPDYKPYLAGRQSRRSKTCRGARSKRASTGLRTLRRCLQSVTSRLTAAATGMRRLNLCDKHTSPNRRTTWKRIVTHLLVAAGLAAGVCGGVSRKRIRI